MHVRCPHCHNPIELADIPSSGEIACAGCGSSFQIASFSTATFEKPESRRIGKFEIVGTLGQGAFGTVLKARDTELDRFVAIKIPRAGNVGTGQEDVDRFLREARAVAQLRFPSIIAVHEVGMDNGAPYLVSDFVEGVTFADMLTRRGLTFQESAKLIAEVADALQYAHSLGVVHRDVKPSNIMLRHPSPSGRGAGGEGESQATGVGDPVLMDFGLAKRDAGEITMTIDGQVLGTPAYMSPEQARGDAHKVDGRSDVYSLGVILYQLLTGELPFRGNKAMLLHQVLHDDPKPPRSLNDKVPRDLETIALKAMAKEPGRRYASAKELAEDLRRWLAGEPILARPVEPVERAWRWCKRNPALAGVTFSTILSGVALATVSWIAFANTAKLENQIQWANQTHEVQLQIEVLFSSIIDAENASQDFLATGRDTHLTQFRTAIAKSHTAEKRLQNLTADHQGHGLKLKRITPKIEALRIYLGKAIVLRKQIEGKSDPLEFLGLRDQQIEKAEQSDAKDEIRQTLSEMAAEEAMLTTKREEEIGSSTRITTQLLGAAGVLSILFLLVGATLIVRVVAVSVVR